MLETPTLHFDFYELTGALLSRGRRFHRCVSCRAMSDPGQAGVCRHWRVTAAVTTNYVAPGTVPWIERWSSPAPFTLPFHRAREGPLLYAEAETTLLYRL